MAAPTSDYGNSEKAAGGVIGTDTDTCMDKDDYCGYWKQGRIHNSISRVQEVEYAEVTHARWKKLVSKLTSFHMDAKPARMT